MNHFAYTKCIRNAKAISGLLSERDKEKRKKKKKIALEDTFTCQFPIHLFTYKSICLCEFFRFFFTLDSVFVFVDAKRGFCICNYSKYNFLNRNCMGHNCHPGMYAMSFLSDDSDSVLCLWCHQCSTG